MSSVRNFAKFKNSREASATVPRRKYETLKYKYKCLKRLFEIYDTNVQLTYSQAARPSGQRCACDSRDVYVQADAEELDNNPTTDRSKSALYELAKAQEASESNYRSERDEFVADKPTAGPVCVNYVQEYRSTPFDRSRTAAESCGERPAYRTRRTIGLVKFFSRICGGDAQSATDDGTSNRRGGCKRKRKKRRRRKRSLITLF
ncbi:hypothetical protein EVAR_50099_1 [Eumeta japonica]|uniref:Uncharacterized protein n=1 Tax=Eumeta variegata TaxID=151549 RepID=A0A4C1XUD2_EUMVA|nr:hypothetical protein EVAR_50099_1 [Eumeta japonica]